ncbi:MAG TPA: helix-turn-helix domain-containing protein [Pseudonocardia sp.]
MLLGMQPGPTTSHRGWIAGLSPRAEVGVEEAKCPRSIVEDAVARVGEKPVQWAIELARTVAGRILDEVPGLGGGAAAFERLCRGNEATTLRALVALGAASPAGAPASEATLEGIREYVRRAVPLEQVLHGVRVGQAETTEAFLRACAELVDPAEVVGELTAVTRELFRYVDGTADAMIREYLAEHEAWSTSVAAARAGTVRALLTDDKAVDHGEASRALGYDLGRTHLAAVLWSDSADAAPAMQTAANDVLRSRGATSTLVVPTASSQVWAWGAVPAGGSVPQRTEVMPGPGLYAALGTAADGVAGFRRSHIEAEGAQRVERLRREAGKQPRRTTRYADVAVVALLSTNLVAAGEFTRRELGALAERSESMDALRTTLRHYLDAERSLVTVARSLHVARGTVTYRVKRAHELLGHDSEDRRFALRAALELADELGDAGLQPAPDPARR